MLRRVTATPLVSVALLALRNGGHGHDDPNAPKPWKAVDIAKVYIPPVPERKTLPLRVLKDQKIARKFKLEERKKRAAAKPREHPFSMCNVGQSRKAGSKSVVPPAQNTVPGSSGKTISELGDRPGIPWQVWLN
jgi:hypothetical protein